MHSQRLAATASAATTSSRAATTRAQERMQSCQGLVRSVAWLVGKKLPPHVDMEDLISYGQLGLAQAARDFDPSVGSQFSTYAFHRIRGAIYDGLSQMNWFRWSDYHGSRYEQMADELLAVRSEGPTGDSRDCDAEGAWFVETTGAMAVCYLAVEGGTRTWRDPADADPADNLATQELVERLRLLIDGLPSDAKLLVQGVYFEGQSLADVAVRLNVSRSWACRLHARVLERLGRAMRQMSS